MARRAAGIGRAELRVLDYVQKHGPVSVRQTAEHFAAAEGIGRTTVLNVLVRLWRKKHLTRKPGPGKLGTGGGHVYSAREARPRLLRRLIGEFVGDVLGGSVSPFVAYLAEETDLSDTDRRQLVELLRQLEKKGDA
jgi:BlaI family penicillinase repressor